MSLIRPTRRTRRREPLATLAARSSRAMNSRESSSPSASTWGSLRRRLSTRKQHSRPTSPPTATRSSPRCRSPPTGSAPASPCWRCSLTLELGELVAVLGAQRVRLRAGEAELLADLRDFGALLAADRAVGGGHRVQAGEQVGALLAARDQAELTRHEVVLRAAQIARLALRDLHHERGFGSGEPCELLH